MKEFISLNPKRILVRAFIFVLLACGMSMTASAQGFNYICPGITTNNDIFVGNINPNFTTVNINFYDTAGKLNSIAVDLPPGTQTRVNPNTVALTSFTGSVVVTSPVPLAVSADQFEGNTPFEFFYPSELSQNLLIPFLPVDSASADVNVFNPGPNVAEVKVALVQSDGSHTQTRTATVDPTAYSSTNGDLGPAPFHNDQCVSSGQRRVRLRYNREYSASHQSGGGIGSHPEPECRSGRRARRNSAERFRSGSRDTQPGFFEDNPDSLFCPGSGLFLAGPAC